MEHFPDVAIGRGRIDEFAAGTHSISSVIDARSSKVLELKTKSQIVHCTWKVI